MHIVMFQGFFTINNDNAIMKVAYISLAIVLFFLFIIIVFRRYKERIEPNEISLLVDIMTILIGLASLVASAVSISVMLSQEKTQATLLEVQKKEHQPVFAISHSLSKSDSSAVYDVEDYMVENVGERMLSPASISCKTFIKVEYHDILNNINTSVYYSLGYYYNVASETDNLTGVLKKTYGNEYIQNNLKFGNIYKDATKYHSEHDDEYVFVDKVDFFVISYVDIYGENRTNYYRGNDQSTKEDYEAVCKSSSETYGLLPKSITEVTLSDLITPLKAGK